METLTQYIATHNLFVINQAYVIANLIPPFLAFLLIFLFIRKIRRMSYGAMYEVSSGRKVKRK